MIFKVFGIFRLYKKERRKRREIYCRSFGRKKEEMEYENSIRTSFRYSH